MSKPKLRAGSTADRMKAAAEKPVNAMLLLAVLIYVLLPTYTPVLSALDSNGPKFLAMSLMNLLFFTGLTAGGFINRASGRVLVFFKTPFIIAYSGFMLVTLISFTQAVSLPESLLQFSKAFCVFAATFNFAILFLAEPRLMRLTAIAMSVLLLLESLAVYYYIVQFINGSVAEISEIKTVYSNKNILASALFVKLVFAIWLLLFGKGGIRKLGMLAFSAGLLATFFMAARAFYVGIVVLTVVFIVVHLLQYLRNRDREMLRRLRDFGLALMAAFLLFSVVQQFLYPKTNHSRHAQSIASQLATVKNISEAGSGRLDAWKWSWQLLREHPLLGVGSGNWKIESLRYEHQVKGGYSLMFKAHNDFFENAAETGIFGLLFYVGMLLLAASLFFPRVYTGRQPSEAVKALLFICPAGVAFYSVDAFFNFPADRTEIQLLLALFLASGVAALHQLRTSALDNDVAPVKPKRVKLKALQMVLPALAFILISGDAAVLYLNYQSLTVQTLAYPEIKGGKLKQTSDMMLAETPFVPAISSWGESMQVVKARYLIKDKRYDEAMQLLLSDHSNPWDPRRENFLAWMYEVHQKPDSAFYYLKCTYQMKPTYYKYLKNYVIYLENRGEWDEAEKLFRKYLNTNNKNAEVWSDLISLYYIQKNTDKALALADSVIEHVPDNERLTGLRKQLYNEKYRKPWLPLLENAMQKYKAGRHNEALLLVNQFIAKVPGDHESLGLRAFIQILRKDYPACIADVDSAYRYGASNPGLINIKGIALLHLNRPDEACEQFEIAMKKGDKPATSNYNRHCLKPGQKPFASADSTAYPRIQ